MGRPDITKEIIEELYIKQNLRVPEVAEILGCNRSTITRKIAKFKIVKPQELIQENIKATCRERYGGDSPMVSQEVRDRIKQTNIFIYGVENPSTLPEIIAKGIKTRYEKNGGKFESEETRLSGNKPT